MVQQVLKDRAQEPDPAPRAAALTTPIMRTYSTARPKVLAIGASTGGPQALATLLAGLGHALDQVPILIVLHMPADFSVVVSEHLARVSGRPCSTGHEGEVPKPGHIYLAPGHRHLRVAREGSSIVLVHDDGAAENFCRPAVDVLFRSVAECFGKAALGIVLTCMGVDGVAGARTIVGSGGSVIAQDEASSVVWGMPGAIVREGLASGLYALDDMAVTITRLLDRPQRGGRT